jgi:glycosyltransferase involved in cell wall biosynthesis
MRLLIMHPWAGLPSRQSLYVGLQQATGWDLLIVTTKEWRDDYGRVVRARPHPGLSGRLLPLPVGLSGNIPLHYFKTRLRTHIREFEPDCVYIYHEPYALATFQLLQAAKAVSGVPVGVRSAQNIAKRYPPPFRQLERQVYERSDFAVVVSQDVADVMRSKGYSKPISLIPMPVDLRTFFPDPDRSESDVLRIGFVGRLVPEKGIDTAIEALARLPRGLAQLTVIGDGPQAAELRELAVSLGVSGEILWRGALPQPDVAEAYRQLDVIVVPSRATSRWREQFGRVVVEAAASEVPVIVSRSGELPFLVGDLGAGWIVEENSSVAMAEVLARLHDDRSELKEAGQRARLAVEARYSDEAIVDALVKAFSSATSTT